MSKNEKKIQLEVFIKFIIVFIFAALYAWGGMEMKWLRRFLAPSILTAGMFYFSKDWRSLIMLPFLFGSLSLGYGADILWLKILKRGLFGMANGITSSGYNIIKKQWILFGFQLFILISSYIVLGVWNPLIARAEEFVLGMFIATIPIMSATKKES